MSSESLTDLGKRQAELVAALLGAGPPPLGFDPLRLQAEAASLAHKRIRAVARAWPSLSQTLGERFQPLFASFARATPLPRTGGPLADGRAFARWLRSVGEKVADAVHFQALAVDLHYTARGNGLAPRKGLILKIAWLSQSRRLLLGCRLPWLGERWLTIPFFRSRTNVAAQTCGYGGPMSTKAAQ